MMRPNEIIWAIKRSDFSPKDVLTMRPLVAKAEGLESESKFEEAALLWKRMYNSKFRQLQGGLRLIRLFRLKKIDLNFEPIITTLKREFPNKVNPWLESGKIEFDREAYDKAYVDFQKAIEIRDDIPSLINMYITSAEHEGLLESAYPLVKSAFRNHFENDLITNAFLKLAVKLDDHDIKEEAYAILSNQDPDSLKKIAQNMLKLTRVILELDLQVLKAGERTPISFEYRERALRKPKEISENWFADPFASKIHEAMNKTSKVKRIADRKKILFVSHDNWNFMQAIIESFEKEESVEIKTLELQSVKPDKGNSLEALMTKRIFDFEDKWEIEGPNSYWKELLNWADVVYVEWANKSAAWISWILPPKKKLVLRIHSYEAFTFYPMFMNWGNVDQLFGVAPHILDYVNDLARVDEFKTKRLLVPNLNYHKDLALEKKLQTEYSVGMIGYNNKNKNPIMGLKILKILKEKIDNPKLYLMGHPFPKEFSRPEEETYSEEFFQFIKDNGLDQNIEFIEFTTEIDEGIKRFNFILSCSEREGTHESIIQSMLRGTIPVIRKWPILGQYGSAENIYSADWIFNEAPEMADFILEIVKTVNIDEMRKVAKAEAEEYFRFDRIWPMYRDAVLA